MNASGYQDEPRAPIRRRTKTFYPPTGVHPRRGEREFRCPRNRTRSKRYWTESESSRGRAYSKAIR